VKFIELKTSRKYSIIFEEATRRLKNTTQKRIATTEQMSRVGTIRRAIENEDE